MCTCAWTGGTTYNEAEREKVAALDGLHADVVAARTGDLEVFTVGFEMVSLFISFLLSVFSFSLGFVLFLRDVVCRGTMGEEGQEARETYYPVRGLEKSCEPHTKKKNIVKSGLSVVESREVV